MNYNSLLDVSVQVYLIGDNEIADLLSVSRSWIRVERHKRRHGQNHKFNIDPVMIGSMPRYRHEDVIAWINNLTPANDNR
ncbi:MAG: helix-turn-helix domain-containing protein [Planctomycetaceae bacterium]|jgi:hypothetical protein|nr:helix-turn-helix domain-containing protein [Planctomycetaceae bacterium]